MAYNFPKNKKENGFALLMSIIVVGVVISVGLTLLDVTIKQLNLSTNAKDSEIAFHAANAGAECARYIRRENSEEMLAGDSIDPDCFNGTRENNDDNSLSSTGDGDVHRYQYSFTWGDDERCTIIDTIVMSTDETGGGLTLPDVTNYIPGYPETSKDCEAGSICTVLAVKGYNKACSDVGSYGTIEREVLIEF